MDGRMRKKGSRAMRVAIFWWWLELVNFRCLGLGGEGGLEPGVWEIIGSVTGLMDEGMRKKRK
jgi:hypothetical protein